MPIQVVIASLAVVGGFILLVWSVSAMRLSSSQTVARNLAGERRVTDMRELQLERSAIQRALRPAQPLAPTSP